MAELVFQSSLTMEQIEQNFKEFNLFEKLKQALEEALAYERGELKID